MRWLGFTLMLPILIACESTYYSAMEKVGIEKREILVDRVEKARDSQGEAQEQFTSALERYSALMNFDGGELGTIKSDVSRLITEMNSAIAESNEFIASLK